MAARGTGAADATGSAHSFAPAGTRVGSWRWLGNGVVRRRGERGILYLDQSRGVCDIPVEYSAITDSSIGVRVVLRLRATQEEQYRLIAEMSDANSGAVTRAASAATPTEEIYRYRRTAVRRRSSGECGVSRGCAFYRVPAQQANLAKGDDATHGEVAVVPEHASRHQWSKPRTDLLRPRLSKVVAR